MRAVLLLAGLLAATPALAAEAPSASAKASKSEITVGETFTVEVRASGPPGTTFEFPGEARLETLELRSVPPGKDSLPPGVHRYLAAAFALDSVAVPAIPVRWHGPGGSGGEIATAPIPLRVVTMLPKDRDQQQLADVRGPVALGIGRAFWVAVIAATALLGALVFLALARRRRAGPAVVAAAPPVEPDREARSALDALAASGRLARAEYRPFYIELTAIAKRYLERRLSAPIVEMTTAEMMAFLKAAPHGADFAPTLRDLSGAADQIKFARGSGLVEEAERHLAATRTMIDGLEARLRPAPPESGKAA